MKTKKKFFKTNRIILILVLAVIVVVCFVISINTFSVEQIRKSYMTEDAGGQSSDGFIVVGMSQVGSESVWRSANTNSIKKAISRDNGFFLRFSNARQKQENQIKTVREYISQKVDVIAIAPVTATGWDTVLQEAKDAGIPVVITDRQIETSDPSLYTAFVGTNMYEEGMRAGQWLKENLEEKAELAALGLEEDEFIDESDAALAENLDEVQDEIELPVVNIFVLEGTEGSTAQIDRSAGFEAVAKQHPEWNILGTADADFTTSKAEEVMNEVLDEYEDIDIIVSQNDDMTFGVISALDARGITHGLMGMSQSFPLMP